MASRVANMSSKKPLSFNSYHVNDEMATGEGVIVYVMDTGYNPDPKDKDVFFPGKVEFPQQDGDVKPVQPKKTAKDLGWKCNPQFKVVGEPTGPNILDDSARQHGPCMSALIGGGKAGVAPRCHIAPLRCTIAGEPDIEECIKCCEKILNYHKTKHSQKTAIVNCSFAVTYTAVFESLQKQGKPDDMLDDLTQIWISKFQEVVENLINAGMILVASSGNHKQTTNSPWAEWKANLGEKFRSDPTSFRAPQCFDNVIVVGGLDRDGKVWVQSGTGKLVSHYLLASDVKDPCDSSRQRWGTSIATAFMSGIIACILSSAQYNKKPRVEGANVQKHMRQLLEHVSTEFEDGKGNKCRAFMTDTIDLKKIVWDHVN